MIDWIQNAFLQDAALIINPASFSFDRIAVLDVVNLIRRPVMELHIANIHQRSNIGMRHICPGLQHPATPVVTFVVIHCPSDACQTVSTSSPR
nr:type II 3-dehydroquinate dehydratase [Paraburkholderia heleia]